MRELESELAATKSVKVAKAAKVKVQDTQAKSALVGVIAEGLGASGKKKGSTSQENSDRAGGSVNPRGHTRGASGSLNQTITTIEVEFWQDAVGMDAAEEVVGEMLDEDKALTSIWD